MCKKSSTFAGKMQAVVKNTARLFSANVLAQVVGFLVYPVLTRLYSSSDFGLLNLFVSIGGVLVLLATADYQYAIVLPKDKERVRALRQLCTLLAVGMSLLLLISLPLGKLAVWRVFGDEIVGWWWLMPLFVAATAGWNILNYSYVRVSQFKRISLYLLLLSIVGAALKVLLGWLGVEGGLLWAAVIAPWVALLAVTRWHVRAGHRKTGLDRVQVGTVAWEYRNFPLFTLPRSLANTLSGNLPALILTPFFGLDKLGFFAMAMTLAFRPVSMITSSLHQVLFERVTQAVREKQSVLPVFRRRWLQMAALVIPFMGVLMVLMQRLVRILLGPGWEETAEMIRYMMPWVTCVFLTGPLSFISEVFGKQKLFLGIELAYLGLRIGAMMVGIWLNSFEWAVGLLSAVGTAVLLFQQGCYAVILRRYESSRLTQAGE